MLRWSLLFFLWSSSVLLSQNLSQLRVRVIDPSKRPVPQAAISITTEQGGVIFRGTTNASGQFTAPLAPGSYRVVVTHEGFEQQTKQIQMNGQDRQITIPLVLKKESISVTVSGQASRLDTASDSHQDSLKLNASALANLPVKDGDVLSAIAFFANPAGGQSPTIIVDGMERTDSVTLTPSQIQQVRLNNNAYSAEFPKPGKDRIEVDTKAGGDTFHGGFAFRTRDWIFDARNPFAAARLPFSRNGYEASLSGPILKKKLYFFLSADREISSRCSRFWRICRAVF